MPVSAIVATALAANANSFATLAEAEQYFSDRLHSDAWTAATADQKAQALLWATKILDTRVAWKGSKSTQGQALNWPRAYVEDPNYAIMPPATAYSLSKFYLDSDTVPQVIKQAQCELALSLLSEDITQDADTTGLSSITVGSISLGINSADKKRVLPRPVRDLIAPYGTSIDSRTTTKLLRS